MKFLKPDKHKLNLFALLLAAIFIFSSFSDAIELRRNLAVETHIFQLGGEIEKNGRELNRLYAQVHSDTDALPEEEQSSIRNILLKYNSVKWCLSAIFLYLLSCLILHRIDLDKYNGENT